MKAWQHDALCRRRLSVLLAWLPGLAPSIVLTVDVCVMSFRWQPIVPIFQSASPFGPAKRDRVQILPGCLTIEKIYWVFWAQYSGPDRDWRRWMLVLQSASKIIAVFGQYSSRSISDRLEYWTGIRNSPGWLLRSGILGFWPSILTQNVSD